jgi:hypothetical protein
MNPTVQNHLEARRLEERAADDEEVLGFWSKVLTACQDAGSAGTSPANRLLRAYDAARTCAFAIIRAGGYRTRGGESHHFVTFDVARSLVGDADLRQALDRMNGFRRVRHAIEYEAQDDADEGKVAEALDIAERIIVLGGEHLRRQRPHLQLPGPPRKPGA